MSNYQPRPNTGSLFLNDRKQTDRDPDVQGSVVLADGREYWVAGWYNLTRDGSSQYLRFNIGREKEPRDAQAAVKGQPEHPAQRSVAGPPMQRRENLPVGSGSQGESSWPLGVQQAPTQGQMAVDTQQRQPHVPFQGQPPLRPSQQPHWEDQSLGGGTTRAPGQSYIKGEDTAF